MQTPTISVYRKRQFVALVSAPTRPQHDYTYGASKVSLRPVVGR